MVCLCICDCSLDGAGWVAGIRKDTADYNEENEASLEDNYENVVRQKCFLSFHRRRHPMKN